MFDPVTAATTVVGVVHGINEVNTLAKTVVKYAGLVEDKLDQLANSKLGAAVRHLKAAIDSERERESLLRAARDCFTEAIELEKGRRLADAYLGLALCHVYLGDRRNAHKALSELLLISNDSGPVYKIAHRIVGSEGPVVPKFLGLMPHLAVCAWAGGKIMRRAMVSPGDERAEELAKFQTAARELLEFALAAAGMETKRVSMSAIN
jgi:hypothetical protein